MGFGFNERDAFKTNIINNTRILIKWSTLA